MERFLKFLSVWADTISVASFLLWLFSNSPTVSEPIINFVSKLPFTLRLVIAVILEIAIAYSLGAMARRLLTDEPQPLFRLPFKLAVMLTTSLLLALASTYNLARLLFLDQFVSIWSYLILLIVIIFLLWLRGVFVRSHLSAARSFPWQSNMVQRVITATCGIVYFAFVVERVVIR